jgi:hypothetical protein
MTFLAFVRRCGDIGRNESSERMACFMLTQTFNEAQHTQSGTTVSVGTNTADNRGNVSRADRCLNAILPAIAAGP